MALTHSNLTGGLRVQTQIPLDVKTYCPNEATLASLGLANNLAYTYYQGLIVYCIEEGTRWEWREVVGSEEGLLTTNFTYPEGTTVFGINYSNRSFNFFPAMIVGPTGPQGEMGETGPEGPEGPAGEDGTTYMENGVTTTYSGDGTEEDPYSIEVINLQKVINIFPYFLTSAEDKNTLFIDNAASNVIIYIPNTLPSNFSAAFVQKGSGDVQFVETGSAVLRHPLGDKIKAQYHQCLLERELNTNNFYLIGSCKT